MSPIPKPPKAPNPVQKAIAALIEETQRKGSAVIDGVIVHPADLPALKALLTDDQATRSAVRTAVFAPAPKADGPLTKAWKKEVERLKNAPLMPLGPGVQITGVSWDELHVTNPDGDLQKMLEDSLWAIATLHVSIFTREDLYHHVGPGHMENDWYVKRLNGGNEVMLLCKCQTILVMKRCRYGAEVSQQCEEPAFPKEATLIADIRCGTHAGTQRGAT